MWSRGSLKHSIRICLVIAVFVLLCFGGVSAKNNNSGTLELSSIYWAIRINYEISGATITKVGEDNLDTTNYLSNERALEGGLDTDQLRISGAAIGEGITWPASSLDVSVVEEPSNTVLKTYTDKLASGSGEMKFDLVVPVSKGGTYSFYITQNCYMNYLHTVKVSGSLYPVGPNVSQENHQPTVSLDYSPQDPMDTDSIWLKADAEDPDGDQLMYSWFIWGNEIVNETGTELLKQLASGDYEYTVKVSDGKGGIAEDTVRFTVIKKTPAPPCNGLLVDLEEGPGSVVIAKVVDDCEHKPLQYADLYIRIFHTYNKQLDKWINGKYVNVQKETNENGEAFIQVNGNPGDMYRVDVYASKEKWDTSDSSIHVTIE